MNTKKATEGAWLTQIELENEAERSFVKAVLSFGSIDNWRDATDEEKQQWEAAHPVEEPAMPNEGE